MLSDRHIAKPEHRSSLPSLSSDRLAALSDAMFGVAMTLLATTLMPQMEAVSGASALTMLAALREPLTGVALSFAIAAVYWMSQQRRLAMTSSLAPGQTVLHLVFLFLIVLLPISTGLYIRSAGSQAAVAIYGSHLVLIAAANLALWTEVHRRVEAMAAIVPSALTLMLLLFGTALAVGLTKPWLAQYFWFMTFATSLLSRLLHRPSTSAPVEP